MDADYRPVVNLEDLELKPYQHGEQYQCVDGFISEALALTQIGAAYTEVPPGKSACPFHVHHMEDEMFFVLAGQGEYRFGDATYQVREGDVLGAPRGGPEYAHKLTNTGDVPLKYLVISSKSATEICEYPDSGKFMVRHNADAEAGRFHYIGRMETAVDYWDGEAT